MDPFVSQFQGFVTDLHTVEKRSIVALTEIARDALNQRAHLAPSLATVIINRALEAPPNVKLPVLYLLDSITKTVGGPYKTYFAQRLPDVFYNAWTIGGPSIHRSLEKLLGTWNGVFSPQTIAAIRARLPPSSAPAAAPGGYKPMVPDPRLAQGAYAAAGGYPGMVAPMQPSYALQQPAGAYGAATIPALQPMYSNDAVSQLAAALLPQGAVAAPVVVPAAIVTPAVGFVEKPQYKEFTAERIKEPNPSAVHRLMTATEKTRSQFMDRKFLKRQKRASNTRQSRMWYIELETWMATAGGNAENPSDKKLSTDAKSGGQAAAIAAPVIPAGKYSVPVDDDQPRCALSGERFEQYWDDEHEEWRYRDAKKLTPKEAAAYGLKPGSIVLVTALGPPSAGISPGKAAATSGGVKKRGLDDDDGEQPDVKKVKAEATSK